LLPLLLGMAVLVGQLNESRLFDAFLPVAIAALLVAVDNGKKHRTAPQDSALTHYKEYV